MTEQKITLDELKKYPIFANIEDDVHVVCSETEIVVGEDSPLNISPIKRAIGRNWENLLTEYDEDLEKFADYTGLEELQDALHILKNGNSVLEWAVNKKAFGMIEELLKDEESITIRIYIACMVHCKDNIQNTIKVTNMLKSHWETMLEISSRSSWEWGIEKAIEMGVNDWNTMLYWSVKSSFKWGCEKAIEMGADDWDEMFYHSAGSSFQWGCEKAIVMGANNWDAMLARSSEASFQWGCEKAIEMGARDWENMLLESTSVSFEWGIEKANEMARSLSE